MKKIIIGLIVAFVSFVIGLSVFYWAMPKVAPDVVNSTKVHLDSLGLIDYELPDSLKIAAALEDSTSAIPDSLLEQETISALPEKVDSVSVLTDSLQTVQQLLEDTQSEVQVLRDQMEQLQQQIESLETKRVQAESISATLSKLEDEQLGAILKDLSSEILEMIYTESSARNQTKLLQAMPPERAASFVRSLVDAETERESETTTEQPSTEPLPSVQ